MQNLYDEFVKYLEREDKEAAFNLVLSRLQDGEIDILNLYTKVLAPSLNNMTFADSKLSIWKEHIRSSIIRTIIENCYPYIIRERNEKYKIKTQKRVAVVCPSEEYHEIGARMIADFFTLLGYETIFVGSNTPKEEFLNAVKIIDLDYIAISVTNYYHLVTAQRTIEKIREIDSDIKIIVGGHAFNTNKQAWMEIGADINFEGFDDIKKLAEGDKL